MKRLVGCLVFLLGACAEDPKSTLPPLETEDETQDSELTAKFNESIRGRWEEDECRPVTGPAILYRKRQFDFLDEKRMHLTIQVYKDIQCTEEFSKVVTGGAYSLAASSERRKQFELRFHMEPVFYQTYKGCTIAHRPEPGTPLMEKWYETLRSWEKPLCLRVVGDDLQEIFKSNTHGPRLTRQAGGVFVGQQ